ncbi:hypothetical protein FJTKL_08425 [Diaporthe vaccinii]|uniref:Uncharacterized protein n=1 Tax=Diaporthe vaccinii TaxID=105482 RepID=A0ABR4ERZ7_9PEZI
MLQDPIKVLIPIWHSTSCLHDFLLTYQFVWLANPIGNTNTDLFPVLCQGPLFSANRSLRYLDIHIQKNTWRDSGQFWSRTHGVDSTIP